MHRRRHAASHRHAAMQSSLAQAEKVLVHFAQVDKYLSTWAKTISACSPRIVVFRVFVDLRAF